MLSNSPLHLWTLDPDEATRLQETLRQRLVLTWDGRSVNSIAGVDVSFTQNSIRAAIVILRYPDLTTLVTAIGESPNNFPYIPGLLAFRLGPAILAAWQNLTSIPDVVMFHGHGIAHPRGIGLASHMGLWLRLPTLGVAKSRLVGFHAAVDPRVGDWSKLHDERDPSQIIGAILRTKANTAPVYLSPGYMIDLDHALGLVQACCQGYRLPEPIRSAHHAASATN